MSSRKRGPRPAPAPQTAPVVPDNIVTVGHNTDAQMVCVIFGDPLAAVPHFVTFTRAQALQLADHLRDNAEKLRG